MKCLNRNFKVVFLPGGAVSIGVLRLNNGEFEYEVDCGRDRLPSIAGVVGAGVTFRSPSEASVTTTDTLKAPQPIFGSRKDPFFALRTLPISPGRLEKN